MNKELTQLRAEIDEIDAQIKNLLVERMQTVLKIGQNKKQNCLNVYDSTREQAVLEKVTQGLSGAQRNYVYNVYLEIIKNSKNIQK